MLLLGMCYVTETYAQSFQKQLGSISLAAVRDRVRIEKLKVLYPAVHIVSISNDGLVGDENVEANHHVFGAFGARIVQKLQECVSNIPNAEIAYVLADYCRMPTVYAASCFKALPEMFRCLWAQHMLHPTTVILLPNIYHCHWATVFATSAYDMFEVDLDANNTEANPLCQATEAVAERLDTYKHEDELLKIVQSHPRNNTHTPPVAFVSVRVDSTGRSQG